MPLDVEFIKMSHPEAIFKWFHEHLLVWMDDINCHLVKMDKVLPQKFKWALTNIEKASGDHLSVPTYCELVD